MTWSTGNDCLAAHEAPVGGGTVNAGLLVNGAESQTTEEYDGSSWLSGNAPLAERDNLTHQGSGQTDSGMAGSASGTGTSNTSEFYGGVSWTAGNNMGTNRRNGGGSLSDSDGIITGTVGSSATESYNGTSFSAETSYPGSQIRQAGVGGVVDYISSGGYSPNTECYSYNGSSWTAENSMNTGRAAHKTFGTTSSAITAGGDTTWNSVYTDTSEEWNGTSWSSGDAMPTAKTRGGCGGTDSTSGLIAAGGKTNVLKTYEWSVSAGPAISNTFFNILRRMWAD